jgi:hypothetical protein
MNKLVYVVIGESDSPFVKSLNWFLRDSGQNLPGLNFHDCQSLEMSGQWNSSGVEKALTEMAHTVALEIFCTPEDQP